MVAGARSVLATMRPVMLLEINDGALRAQGVGADDLLQMLQQGHGYEILVFSPVTGLVEPFVEGGVLSANIIAVPKERLPELVANR